MQTSAAETLKTGFEAVEARRARIERWFMFHGFELDISFPKIRNGFSLTDAEYVVRQNDGWELFYRPASRLVSYYDLLVELGQRTHWTLYWRNRKHFTLRNTETGYWFWAQVGDENIRLGQGLHREHVEKCAIKFVITGKRIPLLEEYAIIWHLHKAVTGEEMDLKNWIWLATQFRGKTLDAMGESGYGINIGTMNSIVEHNCVPADCGLRLVEMLG